MLRPLGLVDDFNRIERALPDDWAEARLQLMVADEGRYERAAALLGPANPGRRGKTIRLTVARRGAGLPPDAIRRLLRRLDAERIGCRLEVAGTDTAGPAAEAVSAGSPAILRTLLRQPAPLPTPVQRSARRRTSALRGSQAMVHTSAVAVSGWST